MKWVLIDRALKHICGTGPKILTVYCKQSRLMMAIAAMQITHTYPQPQPTAIVTTIQAQMLNGNNVLLMHTEHTCFCIVMGLIRYSKSVIILTHRVKYN